MKINDSTIRRRMLRPLVRRHTAAAGDKKLDQALSELEERAFATSLLPDLVTAQKQIRQERPAGRWKDPPTAMAMVKLSLALYVARLVSLQEYIFLVAQTAEGVRDDRLRNQQYPEIRRLSDA